MTTTLPQSLQSSPYFAGLEGKTPEESHALQLRIDELPKAARTFIFDGEVPGKLMAVLEQNSVPPQYVLAMAKILFLATLGDVSIGSVEQLLQKLGLEKRQASVVGAGLTMILSDVIAERGRATIGQRMPVIPPLTQRVPPMSPTGNSSKPAGRNIIDLRKQQEG